MAILSMPDEKMVLADIYQYILDNYSYFRNRGPGWRNSIRHNLSLNDCFVKSTRSANGKGHFWAIHPANLEDFKKGDFRRRKAQRKVRRHMGLSVPDDDDDDDDDDSPISSPVPLVAANGKPPIAAVNRQLAYHHHSIPTLPPPSIPPPPSSIVPPTVTPTQPLLPNHIVPTNAAAFLATQHAINFFQTLTHRFAMNQSQQQQQQQQQSQLHQQQNEMDVIYKRLMGFDNHNENVKQQHHYTSLMDKQRSMMINHQRSATNRMEFSIESLLASNNVDNHHLNHNHRLNVSPSLNFGSDDDVDEELINNDKSSSIIPDNESISDDNSLSVKQDQYDDDDDDDDDEIVDLVTTTTTTNQQPVNLSKD
nr:hepatocyte nuclear factor 3-beta-like [Dermatophagoides farinae]